MVNPKYLAGLGLMARSGAVGAVATLTDLGMLALLVSGLGVPVRVASIPALTLGVVLQFVGNKWFAFRSYERGERWRDTLLRQGMPFLGVEALAFAANLVLFDLVMAHTSLPYLPVRLATTAAVYLLVCLPLWSRIFKPKLEET